MKKSQLSVFIVLGLLIVILYLILISVNGPGLRVASKRINDFHLVKDSFEEYSDRCLKQTTEDALHRYGYDYVHEQMEYYIRKNFFRCVGDYNEFRKQGFNISYDEPLLNLSIDEQKVQSILLVNLNLSKMEQKAFIEKFESNFDRPEVNIDGEWKFRGILYKYWETDDPRPMHIFTVKIDLEDPTIGFYVTPKIEPNIMTTSDFLTLNSLQLAINGGLHNRSYPHDVLAFAASEGVVYTDPEKKPDVTVMITKDNKISFGPPIPDNLDSAISGQSVLIIDGEIRGGIFPGNPGHKPQYDNLNPYTSIGYDKEGNWLILIIVDGRDPGVSEGLNYLELAQIFMRFNTHNAISMDGGGSTTLVLQEGHGYEVLNNPSDGAERAVANHIGVYAEQMP